MNKDLTRMKVKDPKAIKAIGIDPSKIKEMAAGSKEISPDEWRMLKKVNQEVEKQKEALSEQFNPSKAKKFIKKQRKKNAQRYGTKSMFVRRSWLSI